MKKEYVKKVSFIKNNIDINTNLLICIFVIDNISTVYNHIHRKMSQTNFEAE